MKTQISRWSDDATKRRSGIYQQQGRMVTDADLNELMELLKRRVDDALGDVIGSGAPRTATVGLIENGPLIKRATLYVDGVRARLESSVPGTGSFGLSQQADFPSPPAFPAGDQVLYADVWEWATTALQDPSLLDPALHGADTATRTQTLAQVKWCPATIDPTTSAKNPAKGDALLSLEIREGSNEADPCDPCASEIALEGRVGNYLFRVEVHAVQGSADAPTEVTLKWSAENGAEQHAQADVPADFTRGDWIYEFYSDTTEKHVGVHLTPGFDPSRAVLTDGWPGAANLPDASLLPFVRRWDGYGVFIKNGAAWTVKSVSGSLQAKDKGRAFEPLPDGVTPTHGNFKYSAPNLTAQLSELELTLSLDGKKFVAGDYWLATIREGAATDQRVQLASRTPLGITHHYVVLGRANGATVQPLSDAEIRRLSFPRLTDLTADRVAYSPTSQADRWTDVLDDGTPAPVTVQRAIDLMVERLDSSDIRYVIPSCGDTANPSVRSLLALTSGGNSKVDAILTKLLCDLKGTHLPLDKSGTDLPPVLSTPGVTTVQQALTTIAGTVTGLTAEATVGAGGQYATLSDALAALAAANDIALTLLPGVQNLPNAITLTGKRTIRITGVGAYASKVTFGSTVQLGAREILLNDLSMVGQGAGNLVLQADRIVAKNNAFARVASWSSHSWSKRFGGASSNKGFGVAVDSNGNSVLVGRFNSTLNFGGENLTATGGSDVCVAKFNPSGTHVWSKRFGGTTSTSFDVGQGVAVDSAGNVLLIGYFNGTISFGGASLSSLGPNDIFVAKLDAAGNHVWSKRFGGVTGDQGYSICADSLGNVVITGLFSGSFNFGGAELTAQGPNDIFVVKLDSGGNHLWSKRFGATDDDRGLSVTVDGGNNVLLTGYFVGPVSFGGATLGASATGADIFIVKLDSGGNHLWSVRFGSAAVDFGSGIATDSSGNVLVTGLFSGTANFGSGDFVSAGSDAFVVKLSPGGVPLWARHFAGSQYTQGMSCAFDTAGNALVSGLFAGTIFFGSEKLVGAGEDEIFVLKLDASGNHVWSKRFGSTGFDQGASIAVDASGNIFLTGMFSGTVNFGGADLTASGGAALYIAKLVPEPLINPLVTIRARDATHGADLVWSQNDMLTTIADGSNAPQPRTALAIATPNIGGDIIDNTINGRVQLLSDLPFELSDPIFIATGVTSVGGGAYLTIRGNHLARISTRYESTAPTLDAFGSLIVTDNLLTETNNTAFAETITLDNNQFLTQATTDLVGYMAARSMTIVGNQATNPEAGLRFIVTNFRDAANSLAITRTGSPTFQPNAAPVWYFGGVGTDLS